MQYWSSFKSTKILSYLLSSIDLILSKASPHIHLTEFFLVEKIAFMYISKPITQAYASQIKRNGTAEDFFWTTDEEFHAASKNSISLDCDGDSTN